MDSNSIIEFEHVSLKLGGREIHGDVSFSVTEGETLTILGPSGTGKTLLFKILIGLIPVSGGRISLRGKVISGLNEREYLEVRKDIGILFQGAALFDSISVFENIAYPLREAGIVDDHKIRETVEECLGFVDLKEFGAHRPLQLSGGQRKRIGLARALANAPSIMLFDEPTTGLDPTSVRLIDDLILRLSSEKKITSLVITHDIASARNISNRWLLLSDGKVQAIGPVRDIETKHTLVRDFVSGNWRS